MIFRIVVLMLISFSSYAGLVSGNLSDTDRKDVVRTLGYGSSLKTLGDPYPLGGFSGFELGIAVESIPTEDFTNYGDGTAGGKLLTYPVVSLGKGLYENVDLFVHFSMFGPENRVGVYGGLVRWGFFESDTLPLTLSLSLQSASNNFDNQITGEVFSAIFNLGLNFEESALYMGVGKVNAKADFVKELTDSAIAESSSAEDLQFKLGGVYYFRPYFLSLEFNRYVVSHFSARVGLRF